MTASTMIFTIPFAKVAAVKSMHLPCSRPSHCVHARWTGMQWKLSVSIQVTAMAELIPIMVYAVQRKTADRKIRRRNRQTEIFAREINALYARTKAKKC